MHIPFHKYHALGNAFVLIERGRVRLGRRRWTDVAKTICDRSRGVGADGILVHSSRRGTDGALEIINADGSPAEKSGNGLRIGVLHCWLRDKRRRRFDLRMDNENHSATVIEHTTDAVRIRTSLGSPSFETARVPVRSRNRFMINAPLKIGGVSLPVTCLSVGNPHTVLMVDSFGFDWRRLGAEIETHRAFPERTNVEFVKVMSRRKLRVADWERGAGATGSSGTGATASVCAAVVLGICERKCEVMFDTGSLFVEWDEESGLVELTGPAVHVASGEFNF